MNERKPLVSANWKMNGAIAANKAWAEGFAPVAATLPCDTVVFVPAVYLMQMVSLMGLTAVEFGAEDISEHASGAFTGETAAPMVRDCGGKWALVGHSERRQYHAEDNAMTARKVAAALACGLRPMLCVGETLEEREAGRTDEVICAQLRAVLEAVGANALVGGAIAYEPVWAIGTGKTATPEIAQAAHAALRAEIARYDADAAAKVRILYGGSVKPANARAIFACPDIDGALVGGASLKADSFAAICEAAEVRR